MIALAAITVLAILFTRGNAMANEIKKDTTDPFNRWDFWIEKYARQYNVPFEWIKAIMLGESNLGRAPPVARGLANPDDINGSKSSDGKSWGLMQLTLPTARMFENVTERNLNDPETSIRLGAKYLQWLMSKTPTPYTQEEFVIRAYNGGPGFRSTAAGQRDTPAYYTRFKTNLARVKASLA